MDIIQSIVNFRCKTNFLIWLKWQSLAFKFTLSYLLNVICFYHLVYKMAGHSFYDYVRPVLHFTATVQWQRAVVLVLLSVHFQEVEWSPLQITRRCGPLCGPSSSSCRGPLAKVFWTKKKLYYTILAQVLVICGDHQ